MIFVDTGAWYALATPSDPDHEQAKAVVAASSEPFLTLDYVIDELLMLFVSRGQKWKAIEWIRDVLGRGGVRVVPVGEDALASALNVFQQFADKNWSFTDCTSYVLMEKLSVSTAFSFDDHFRQFGTVPVVPQAK